MLQEAMISSILTINILELLKYLFGLALSIGIAL
jgi:hypothetical protein